jgi:hypothetical protein
VEEQSQTGNWNPKTEVGTRQARGILSASTNQTTQTGFIIKAVEQFVQRRTGKYHAEGDLSASISADRKNTHTIWMYNWNTRHGELDLWLFAFPDGKRVAFVIHHREERLN